MTTDEISQTDKAHRAEVRSPQKSSFLLAELARDLIDSSQVSTPVAIHDAAGKPAGPSAAGRVRRSRFPTDENSPEFYRRRCCGDLRSLP